MKRFMRRPHSGSGAAETPQQRVSAEDAGEQSPVEKLQRYLAEPDPSSGDEAAVPAGAEASEPPASSGEGELSQVGERVAAVLRSAEEAADDVRAAAERDAERLLRAAEEEANTTRATAQGSLDETRAEIDELRSETERRSAERLHEADEEAARRIADADARGRQVVKEAEQRAQQLEEDMRSRHGALAREAAQFEERLSSLVTVFRAMTSQLEELVAGQEEAAEEPLDETLVSSARQGSRVRAD